MNNLSKSEIEPTKIKITHTMANGTILDSIEGYEIPYTQDTKIIYNMIAEWIIKKTKREEI